MGESNKIIYLIVKLGEYHKEVRKLISEKQRLVKKNREKTDGKEKVEDRREKS